MVKTEKVDGTLSKDPYIAFRKRNEKILTRKNRKNDEICYEKMFKLKKQFEKLQSLLEATRLRESLKLEHIKMTQQIFSIRYQTNDWDDEIQSQLLTSKGIDNTCYQNGCYSQKNLEVKSRNAKRNSDIHSPAKNKSFFNKNREKSTQEIINLPQSIIDCQLNMAMQTPSKSKNINVDNNSTPVSQNTKSNTSTPHKFSSPKPISPTEHVFEMPHVKNQDGIFTFNPKKHTRYLTPSTLNSANLNTSRINSSTHLSPFLSRRMNRTNGIFLQRNKWVSKAHTSQIYNLQKINSKSVQNLSPKKVKLDAMPPPKHSQRSNSHNDLTSFSTFTLVSDDTPMEFNQDFEDTMQISLMIDQEANDYDEATTTTTVTTTIISTPITATTEITGTNGIPVDNLFISNEIIPVDEVIQTTDTLHTPTYIQSTLSNPINHNNNNHNNNFWPSQTKFEYHPNGLTKQIMYHPNVCNQGNISESSNLLPRSSILPQYQSVSHKTTNNTIMKINDTFQNSNYYHSSINPHSAFLRRPPFFYNPNTPLTNGYTHSPSHFEYPTTPNSIMDEQNTHMSMPSFSHYPSPTTPTFYNNYNSNLPPLNKYPPDYKHITSAPIFTPNNSLDFHDRNLMARYIPSKFEQHYFQTPLNKTANNNYATYQPVRTGFVGKMNYTNSNYTMHTNTNNNNDSLQPFNVPCSNNIT